MFNVIKYFEFIAFSKVCQLKYTHQQLVVEIKNEKKHGVFAFLGLVFLCVIFYTTIQSSESF